MLSKELESAFTNLAAVPGDNSPLVLSIYRLAPPEIVNYYKKAYLTVGGAPEVLKRRFLRTGSGFEFEDLAKYGPGTLGNIYYHFIRDNGLDSDLMGHPVLKLYEPGSDDYIATCRSLEIHDLLHIIGGHGVDAYGEWAVASLIASQRYNLTGLTWWPVLMVRLALVVPEQTPVLMDLLTDNWLRGVRAKYFYPADWEGMFSWPLEKVQAELNIAKAAPKNEALVAIANGPFPSNTRIPEAVETKFWQLVQAPADTNTLLERVSELVELYDDTLLEQYRAEMERHGFNLPTASSGMDELRQSMQQAGQVEGKDFGQGEADIIGLQAYRLAKTGNPYAAAFLSVLVMRGMINEPEKLEENVKAISEGWWRGRELS